MRGRTLLYLTTFVIATIALGNGYSGFSGGSLLSILNTFHEHVCDGSILKVRCPRKTLISMQFAQYGRQVPSSRMCPAPTHNSKGSYRSLYTPYHYLREDTNCQATTSLTVLLDLCQNKHRCHLVASAETFRQDPCPGTSKYLEVAYKCRPESYKNEVACEGDQVELWCHRATRIAIHSAFFGQTPNDSSKCLQTHHNYIDCRARDTLDVVRRRCHGRKQCVLEAEEYVFGNPCPSEVNKYLNVTYTCE
ncbi:protein eva-1 homolog C-like [Gigantopelta aegis]|uniref:protein eva-1 homolog C-like n=1 Tax=Gigantopelta aegis TaxID=1735272 RepID=UPI001B88D45C|nr:protein eva-1 homolog C-like [Gigantopelta aegis]